MLIDTHFHLDLTNNMQEMIQDLKTSDIGIIAVGTTPKAFDRTVKYCRGSNNIKVSLGFHPQLVAERKKELELFLKLAINNKYIGEIGLDFNSSYKESKVLQLSYFQRIIQTCAEEGNKTVSIHSVKAAGDVINILKDSNIFKTCHCILHWFTGTISECEKAVEAGAFFSINPQMLTTKSGREIIRRIPSNRILIETDAPFTKKFRNVHLLKKELIIIVEEISNIRQENILPQIEHNTNIIIE